METVMNQAIRNDPKSWGKYPYEIKGEIALFFGKARISKKRYQKRADRNKIFEEWQELHDYKNRRDAIIEIYPS